MAVTFWVFEDGVMPNGSSVDFVELGNRPTLPRLDKRGSPRRHVAVLRAGTDNGGGLPSSTTLGDWL